MILFFNVFITNNRISGPNSCDRLDLFKYCLSSYSCIDDITDVIIYCELDLNYKNREIELKDYIYSIFNGKNIQYYNYSPSNQKQWQEALENSNILNSTEPILYSGNDDHIFIDYDLISIREGIKLLNNESNEQINSFAISHWPEHISYTYHYPFTDRGMFWEAEFLATTSIVMVNTTFFKHLFFDLEIGETFMRRTDRLLTNLYPNLGNFAFPSKKPHPKVKTFIPLKGEIIRHFDAYPYFVQMPLSICPQLKIPNGFFENNIKINYCGKVKRDFYNVNPLAEKYLFEDYTNGIDDKKLLEDLPLFWRNKISEIEDHSNEYSRQDLIDARNINHKNLMIVPHNRIHQGVHYHGPLNLEEKYIKLGYR